MTGDNWAQRERAELCDDLMAVGPDAPTLCAGWSARDLAAHLVLRERRPDASPGILISPLARWTERVQAGFAAMPWPDLVAELRTGPPPWSPFALPGADRLANTAEFFVHHEDIRRAQPTWSPRELPNAFTDVLWALARRLAPVQYRSVHGTLIIERTDGDHQRRAVGKGLPQVIVAGPAAELLLYGYGRREAARVTITGPDSEPGC